MEACGGGLGYHRFGGVGRGQEDADPGAFAFDGAFQVADHADAHILTRLDGDDAHRGATGPEVEPPVQAPVRALLAEVAGLGGEEGERPFLELMILGPAPHGRGRRECPAEHRVRRTGRKAMHRAGAFRSGRWQGG